MRLFLDALSWMICDAACVSESLSGLLIWSVGPVGLSDISESFIRCILLVIFSLALSFTTPIDSLFTQTISLYQLKLHWVNQIRYLCFVNIISHSWGSVSRRLFAVKCCWILSCVCGFLDVKLFIWNVISWNVLVSVDKASGQKGYTSKCFFGPWKINYHPFQKLSNFIIFCEVEFCFQPQRNERT